ncbi:testis-expressed protein 45 [Hemicordylus capensis]|uniref:testis-expressed protein 45 n=1 Tax=Hemicordylus capensis TaxID=884348 RepID=UPI002304A0CB|nr:testis-expressed protein 45 [Hemicordylus capensis]
MPRCVQCLVPPPGRGAPGEQGPPRAPCRPEAPRPPRIPAPLAGKSFLLASHFQVGFERRPQGSTVVSPYRTDYPPRWGSYRRESILPPRCAGVLNQDLDGSWEPRSEMCRAYPAWPLGPRPGVCGPSSRLRMHTDPRQRTAHSVTRDSYPCPAGTPRGRPCRVDKWDDSFPSGDQEKIPLPESLYQQSYPAHQDVPPVTRAPSQHLGGDSVLKGDGCSRHDTLYQSQYRAEGGPPAQGCEKDAVSVVLGDPRYHETVSEQKRAYTVQRLDGCRYDPERAAAQVFQTNIRPGDGCRRFSTIMSESFRWKEPGPGFASPADKNASSILRGDSKNENIGMTTHQFYYGEPKAEDQPARGPVKGRAKLCLGDQRLASFSTTQHSDYLPLPEVRTAKAPNRNLQSSIRFDCPASGPSTTSTQDMLVPHRQPKHQLTEEDLETIKYSHLVHPWRELRWFSTEQKDAYTDKYAGPITLAMGDFQCSSLPLGTMKKYQHRLKTGP